MKRPFATATAMAAAAASVRTFANVKKVGSVLTAASRHVTSSSSAQVIKKLIQTKPIIYHIAHAHK